MIASRERTTDHTRNTISFWQAGPARAFLAISRRSLCWSSASPGGAVSFGQIAISKKEVGCSPHRLERSWSALRMEIFPPVDASSCELQLPATAESNAVDLARWRPPLLAAPRESNPDWQTNNCPLASKTCAKQVPHPKLHCSKSASFGRALDSAVSRHAFSRSSSLNWNAPSPKSTSKAGRNFSRSSVDSCSDAPERSFNSKHPS